MNAIDQLLVEARKTELLFPHLESWLMHARHSTQLLVDGPLVGVESTDVPPLFVSTERPDPALKIRSDDNGIALLRLLRVIPVVNEERSEQQDMTLVSTCR